MWHFEQQFGRDIFIEINAVHNWLATWLEPWLLERWLRRPDVRESLQAAAKIERMRPLRVPAEAPLATAQKHIAPRSPPAPHPSRNRMAAENSSRNAF